MCVCECIPCFSLYFVLPCISCSFVHLFLCSHLCFPSQMCLSTKQQCLPERLLLISLSLSLSLSDVFINKATMLTRETAFILSLSLSLSLSFSLYLFMSRMCIDFSCAP